MAYLLGEILFLLIVASSLGFALGWLLRAARDRSNPAGMYPTDRAGQRQYAGIPPKQNEHRPQDHVALRADAPDGDAAEPERSGAADETAAGARTGRGARQSSRRR